MRHRRHTFRVAVSMTALIALLGCSDDFVSTSAPDAPRAPSVIRVAGGGGDAKVGGLVSSAAPEAASSMVADDGRMMPMPCGGITEFELVGDLPALDTPVDGWHFTAREGLDEAAVARLASVFGMSADVVELPADWGGGWRMGPDDGSAPAIWLGADGLGWWSYSAPWPTMREAEPIAADGSFAEPEPMEPPVGVPSAAEAEQLARQVFEGLGLTVDPAHIETYADDWGASVTLWQVLDGLRTGFTTSVGFGENATITYAGGQLPSPERVTGFERIGSTAGFERLTSTVGGWWGGGMAKIMIDCAPPEMANVADGEPVEPATMTVEIVSVKETWWQLYDVDGSVWLTPGYAFLDSNGIEYTVPAVVDELVEPVEPAPVEPAPVEPGVIEPAPDDGGMSSPGYDPDAPVSTEVVERVIGLDEQAATDTATELGFEVRVVERDGESFPVTADYRVDRVNLVITDGVVTGASVG